MQTGKILIVDDDVTSLKVFSQELQNVGHTVKIALNGEKAAEIVKSESFEIVFTDLLMGKLSGVDVCKAVKLVNEKTAVVLVSSYSMEVEAVEKEFLEKGGHKEILHKTLELAGFVFYILNANTGRVYMGVEMVGS